jgi:hypothetical protein
MPEIELGDRVKHEDFFEHAPSFQPRALRDLNVWRDASHGEFTAPGSTGPGGSNLGFFAAQCV